MKITIGTSILAVFLVCQPVFASSSKALVDGELTEQDFSKQCDSRFEDIKARQAALEAITSNYSVETILRPTNQLELLLGDSRAKAELYESVHPLPAMREVAEECTRKLSKIATDLSLSTALYSAVAKVDVSQFDTETQRYKERLMDEFIRSGVDKSEAVRSKIRVLNEEITEIGQTFDRNIREDVRYVEVDSVEALEGLPQDYIDAHPPAENGKIKISTRYPDYFPVLTFAKSDELRRELTLKSRSRGYPQNEQVLKSLLQKRFELAKFLGYKNYAEYITGDKMIGNPENAQNFLDEVATKAQSAADRDYQQLLTRLQKDDPSAKAVTRWQYSYLSEKIRQEDYQVDSKQVREYFSYNKTRDGIFQLVSDLFDVSIVENGAKTWHESVKGYDMLDKGKVIARFYLDMHPRDGKYQHAAQFPLKSGVRGQQLPEAVLVCNFPEGDELMVHDQVETFLHEFGHLIHTMFSGDHEWASISGISTEWDFVEAPSQMLEEWVWDYDTLKLFATNSKGELIPRKLVEKMRAARGFGRGVSTRVQLYYASLSLSLYQQNPEHVDFEKTMRQLASKYSPFDYLDGTHFYANFGHLNGYSAIYYTYQWSLAIATDMFSVFKEKGLRNKDLAATYREKVLAQGGAKKAADLVQDFLGRPYSFDAYAKYLNGGS